MTYARHYCYRIDFEDGFVYFGVRTCYCSIASDSSYMGSPAVHAAKWLTDIPRVKTIVSVHATRELANKAEAELISSFWETDKTLSLNAAIRDEKFNTQGRSTSEETKQKISKAKLGKKLSAEHRAKIQAGNTGKRHGPCSEETRAKLSKLHADKRWYTDGTANVTLKPEDAIPEGFAPGRSDMLGRKWYTNGTASILLKPGDTIPEEFKPGRVMRSHKQL